MPYMTVESKQRFVSIRYVDTFCVMYGQWYVVHDFDIEPNAIARLNSTISSDL